MYVSCACNGVLYPYFKSSCAYTHLSYFNTHMYGRTSQKRLQYTHVVMPLKGAYAPNRGEISVQHGPLKYFSTQVHVYIHVCMSPTVPMPPTVERFQSNMAPSKISRLKNIHTHVFKGACAPTMERFQSPQRFLYSRIYIHSVLPSILKG